MHLLAAKTVPLHEFESTRYFEGCLPIEEIARRGIETLAHGPMKPVGLVDPRTGRRPHAVVQLRQEDKRGILYNLVGFQTKLRIAEQRRVFRTLPGMENAVFARYGSVHRNTYVNAPTCLAPTLELRGRPGLYLAGQMTGVEGYVESAATGFVAGVNAAFAARGVVPPLPDESTAHGALLRYLVDADPRNFQPMNLNFGLFPPLTGLSRRASKREKNRLIASRALEAIASYQERVAVPGRMTFEEAIRSFELHLRAERNLSPHTRRAYLSDVRQFAESVGAASGPDTVRVDDVRAFLADRHRSQAPTTLGRKLAALRSFFRFLVREGQREADPSVGIPAPRAARRLPNPLAVDDCHVLAEALAEDPRAGAPPRRGCADSGRSRCAAGSGAGRAALRGWNPGRRAGGAGRAGHRPSPR